MLYSFDKNNYSKPVYEHCLQMAKGNKIWAENKSKQLNGREWESACQVSREMLKEYLTTPIEDLAINHYKYLRLRSHLFHGNFPIDRPAFNKWTELTGIEPRK